jgi:phospholipase C
VRDSGPVLARLEQREIARRTRLRDTDRDQQRPRPDRPAGTDLLPQIKHIVVLMMENHSYDNYLGMLPGRGEGFTLGADGEPANSNNRPDGTPVRAHHLGLTQQVAHIPTQSWHASHLQYANGTCAGFVTSLAQTVPQATSGQAEIPMGYWTGADLPFYHGLASTFPLADHWFCSCLGPTFPNRRFMLAGTAHGLMDDLPFAMVDYPPNGTVFDMLTSHGIPWLNYHNVDQASLILRRLLGGGGLTAARRLTSLGRWFPPLVKAVQGNKTCTADLYPLGLARCLLHLRPSTRFFADADAGTLPAFCIVDPSFEAFSEENPQDIRYGESFAAEVITRVMRGKGWPHTLLIWLYDEHGGYYDHVPPPAAPPPDGVLGRNLLSMPGWLRALLKPLFASYFANVANLDAGPHRYNRYGFRVPAVIVSPYARRDYVSTEVFDHTSVLKLVERKWNLPPLTDRDAAAAAPLDALDLDGEPAFLDPPDLPPPALPWGTWQA